MEAPLQREGFRFFVCEGHAEQRERLGVIGRERHGRAQRRLLLAQHPARLLRFIKRRSCFLFSEVQVSARWEGQPR